MTKENFKSRFIFSIDKCIEFAKKIVFDELPDNVKVNLYHRDMKEKHLRLDVEEAIEKLYRDGKIPQWINIGVVKVDSDHTIVACTYSDNFTDDDDMLQFSDEPQSPFQIGGPPSFDKPEKGKKFKLIEFNEEENWPVKK